MSAPDDEEVVHWSDPPCRLMVRTKKQVELYTIPERNTGIPDDLLAKVKQKQVLAKGPSNIVKLTPDAAFIMMGGGVGVVKRDLNDDTTSDGGDVPKEEPFLKGTSGVQMMDFSPLRTYVITWERYYADKCPRNLKLFETATGELVAAFPQKSISKSCWPYLHFTHDEKLAFLAGSAATNEIRVYDVQAAFGSGSPDNDPSGVRYFDRVRVQVVTQVSVPSKANADNASYYFSTFCPGNKDKPARASLHEYSKSKITTSSTAAASGGAASAGGGGGNYPALVSKSLFQAEEMKSHWNPHGNACLVTLQTSVDTSGESYYGKSQLFLFSTIGGHKEEALNVPLDPKTQANGPVLDVQWMPNPNVNPSNAFCVTAGKMPSMTSLHNGVTGQPTFLFGQQHRNTIEWSPHGRFLALAGFGNLAGGLSFWDKNKLKLIPHSLPNVDGTLRASTTTGHCWSPSSRLFACSTTAPRMNVDNCIRVFRYTGEEILPQNVGWDPDKYKPDQLLEVAFVPAPVPPTASATSTTGMHYPDRPQTPPPPQAIQAATAAQSNTNKPASASASKKGPSTSGAASSSASGGGGGRYVPPSARGGRGGGSSLADRLRREKEGSLQGATAVNKKSQAPALAKGATGRVIPGMAAQTTSQTKTKSQLKREKAKLKKQQQQKEEEEAQASAPPPPAAEAPQQVVDPEKRARKIKKTLKQIDDLKQKDSNDLNDDQKAKILSEGSLRSELEQLGL